MRRRKTKTNLYLIILLGFIVVGVSYAYLSTALNITGRISGNFSGDIVIDKDSNSNLSITSPVINSWKAGNETKYQYKFYIKNNGNENYDNFKITLTYGNVISTVDIWNYTYEVSKNQLIVIDKQYNLDANGSLEVNFIISSKSSSLKLLKVKLEAETSSSEVNPNDFSVVFNKTNGWGHYVYQYNVTITNNSSNMTTYWQLNITLPPDTAYNGGWNAIFDDTSTSNLVIKNESYNGRIESGQSISFGLQLKTDTANYIPDSYQLLVR